MFPITEILEILAMVKGTQPFTYKRGLKILATLIAFGADQIPDAAPQSLTEDMGLQCQLQEIVDAQKSNQALAIDWGGLFAKLFQFFLSKMIGGATGPSYNQGGAGPG